MMVIRDGGDARLGWHRLAMRDRVSRWSGWREKEVWWQNKGPKGTPFSPRAPVPIDFRAREARGAPLALEGVLQP